MNEGESSRLRHESSTEKRDNMTHLMALHAQGRGKGNVKRRMERRNGVALSDRRVVLLTEVP